MADFLVRVLTTIRFLKGQQSLMAKDGKEIVAQVPEKMLPNTKRLALEK